MPLNPWRLQLLDAFGRLGTVRAVAAELNMSPSSVSQQLAALEAETRTRLLERVGRRLVLTPAGALLAERARDVLERLDAIEGELAELRSEPVGRLRVSSFASGVLPLLVAAATSLARTHPRLDLELLEVEPHESIPALLAGSCDIAVTVDTGDDPPVPGIRTVGLATDPLLLVLPPGHRLARAPVLTLAELAQERWALDRPGTYLGELVPRLCRRAGFEPLVAGRFPSHHILVGHVAAGLSVAVLPGLAVAPRAAVVTRTLEPFGERRIVAAVRRVTGRRAATSAVLTALGAAAAEAAGAGPPPRPRRRPGGGG
ncbi:LysR family transcriptional regulator [Streptomyces sp. MP131-18]|uniref:LysR family transcriptional regulator n=1 Tax=Streptomyces sp. MP131-18 TaxID=1857892 RepID=UPI00097C2DC0|nr:LysR family transcriptional regulator [Streptomyces sp. MP131-18]ONK11917.1 HTH-type transcriptional regulator GltC [Streptomyces sp. MP131-18]